MKELNDVVDYLNDKVRNELPYIITSSEVHELYKVLPNYRNLYIQLDYINHGLYRKIISDGRYAKKFLNYSFEYIKDEIKFMNFNIHGYIQNDRISKIYLQL